MQIDIFDLMYQPLKINNKIRTIELFGGYGSQLLALKYLGANVEQWKLCEWAVKSIQAYKDIHFENDNTDYSKELTIEEVKQYLFDKGISSNYNEPMNKEQVYRLNEQQARTIYNNIKATHNLVNIQQVKGDDLEIVDKDKYCYIMTYSFPCQDLSLAGKQKGMSDTSTRSGMLWEVERILKECDNKPQILLMENVPQVHGTDNLKDFQKWITSLEEMGYKNYWQDLIATDYGIPQTRNRCFMVSILGNYNYTFPEPIPLKLKLKDLLEDKVDEKYFWNKNNIEQLRKQNINTIDYKWNNKVKKFIFNKKIDAKFTYSLNAYNNTFSKVSHTITTPHNTLFILNNKIIRKPTPKTCFRLQGVKDKDFIKCAKKQSDSSLYHLAGDSICTTCLMAIFGEMLGIDWKSKIKELENDYE